MDYAVFDSLQDSVIVIDSCHGVYYANQAASFLLDVSVKRLKNAKPLSDFIVFKSEIAAPHEMPQDGSSQMREIEYTTASQKSGSLQINLQIDTTTIDLSEADKRWIVYMRDVSLEKILHEKYMGELDQKEDVIKDLRTAQAQLEDYSKNLEKMVEQRTLELKSSNQLLAAILDSLDQGILVFEKTGKILPYFSKISGELFKSEIENAYVQDLLSSQDSAKKQFKEWLSLTFDEVLSFEDVKSLGPNKLERRADKEIALNYHAMRGTAGQLQAVVMVATDKTEEMHARQEADRERSLAKRVIQITKFRIQFRSFARDALAIFSRLIFSLEGAHRVYEKLDVDSFARDLHTFKGGAATFALNDLATGAHFAEQLLSEVQESANGASRVQESSPAQISEKWTQLKTAIAQLQHEFLQFLSQNKELYGGALDEGVKQLELPTSKITLWLERLRSISELKDLCFEIENLFIREEIGSYFSYLDEPLSDLAVGLGKKIKVLKLVQPELRIEAKYYRELFANFIHIFRNAIDHGLEVPETRIQNNKDPAGQIQVKFEIEEKIDNKFLKISISDDGGGIDPEKIRARMKKLGYPPQELLRPDSEIIQVIFDDQFSSRDQISEISGRGVGLAAVKDIATKLGGQVLVRTELGKSTEFIIEVPFLVGEAKAGDVRKTAIAS